MNVAAQTELELTRRCAAGCSSAATILRREYARDVRGAMTRCRLPAADIDEAEARLWSRLLVGVDGDAPRIAGFAGTGPLRAWLRRCAVHEALGTLRRRRPERSDTESWQLPDPCADPEHRMLRAEQAEVFRDLFATALASLEPREREVLRLSVLDEVSSPEIAKRFGVHRVTVARWLGSAREKLARRTGRMYRDHFGRAARVALSQVEISLTSSLR